MVKLPSPCEANRAQAFTLEGLVAGLILLLALLFAMQAVMLTPGAPGVEGEPEVRQQTSDVLDIAERDGSLSELLRYYNASAEEETFAHAVDQTVGYGSHLPPTTFGALINETFIQRGKVVNVIVEYQRADAVGTNSLRMIYRGDPPDRTTVASTTVTLYSNQTLTGPEGEEMELWAAADAGLYPIPDADPDGPLHNVVTVRVIVW